MVAAFISSLGERITWVFRRTAPDPFVLAVLLTLTTIALAMSLTPNGLDQAISYWSGSASGPGRTPGSNRGVWELLSFAMQMCLILVTGTALASAPLVDRALGALALAPRSCAQAAALVASVACLLAIVNWGLGLVAGAVLARKVGQAMQARGRPVHYPLLAAAGYMGMMVWHGGLSGSAPLSMTTETGIRSALGAGASAAPIPLAQTLFSPLNLVITGGLLAICPLMAALLAPRDPARMQSPSSFGVVAAPPQGPAAPPTPDPADRKPLVPRILEDTPIVTIALIAMIGLWALGYYLPRNDAGAIDWARSGVRALTLDSVNLTMLMLGLALHGTPARYVRAVESAAAGCAGIILQFPLYAGIMAIMRESGLTNLLAASILELSTPATLPLLTFLIAAIINMFVPSGGGQWSVQGPIVLDAGAAAGVAPGSMCMSVAYGDQLTNMLQPFWALPLLGITGVKARDIVGYTSVVMLAGGLWISVWLLILA